MNIKKYDNKCVKIIDTSNKIYEGICSYNSSEYNNHEYGKNEESIKILNIIFYKSDIKKIEINNNFSSNRYGNLELLIIDSGMDFIEDAIDYGEKIHNDRLILCIKDNLDKFNDKDEIIKIIDRVK